MGRRRRKVIKVIKPRLPDRFSCPKCGEKKLTVRIEPKDYQIGVKCNECKKMTDKKIKPDKVYSIDCNFCKKPIIDISVDYNDILNQSIAKITCKKCGVTNPLPITGERTNLNCGCPPSEQSSFKIHISSRLAKITCAHCHLIDYREAKATDVAIDVYNRFYDDYISTQVKEVKTSIYNVKVTVGQEKNVAMMLADKAKVSNLAISAIQISLPP